MTTMARVTMKKFEKSPFDKEKKGVKEGSKADKMMDKKQMATAAKKMPKGKK